MSNAFQRTLPGSKGLKITLWLTLIITPFVVAGLYLYLQRGAFIWDTTPVPTDELYYWHQAKTFSAAGFNGGYYTIGENQPRASFSRFYAWGVVIPALYGSVASLFGWYPASIPLTNLALMSAGLLFLIAVIRPGIWQSLALMVLIATYPGFILRYFSSMIALLELSLAFVVGAGFIQLLNMKTTHRNASLWLLFALIFSATIRLTWVFLLIPYALLLVRGRGWRACFTALCLSIAGICLIAVWHWSTAAPYPYALWVALEAFEQGWQAGLIAFLKYCRTNCALLFKGHPLELWARSQIAFMLFATLMWSLWLMLKKKPLTTWKWEALFHALNLGSLLSVVLLYEVFDWRDFRFYHPRIFLSLVVFIGMNHRRLTMLVLLPMIVLLPQSANHHTILLDARATTSHRILHNDWENELKDFLAYDGTGANGWCNTLYHSWYYFINESPILMAVDGGIGLSFAPPFGHHPPPYKSRYLLLDDAYYAQYKAEFNVIRLRDMPNGALYENLDSLCFQ